MPDSSQHHRSPPLGGSYAAAVAIALLGLSPNIVLTTAFTPPRDVLMHDLHTSRTVLELGEGLSNAGYAFGAVLAADLAQRFLQRRLFLIYEVLFVAASLATVLAPDAAVLVVGRVVQGTAGPARGVRVGLLLTLAVVGLAVAAVLGLFLRGRVRLRAPDLDGWLEQGDQALESPPVAAAARSG